MKLECSLTNTMYKIFQMLIILSVGGGGLLRGVQLGLERNKHTHYEDHRSRDEGQNLFLPSLRKLGSINSIATSLSSLYVVPSTLESSIDTISMVVSDAEAVEACYKHAEDHRTLVEPACGAALAALSPHRVSELLDMGIKSAVVIVCGGSAVSIDLLQDYKVEQLRRETGYVELSSSQTGIRSIYLTIASILPA